MTPQPALEPATVLNALTFDVEDYFHVSAFDGAGKRERWDTFESRVCRNTDRILALLAEASTSATFFVLGWVADRHPDLVRRIAEGGHEVASHGYSHRLVYDMTPASFRDDLRRARQAIGAACGVDVRGYRAPSFSITAQSLWALDVLADEGYTFDSSIYPIYRDRYGLPGAPRFAHPIVRPGGRLIEVPPSTMRVAGATLPVGGGGYLRLYPFALTRWALAHLNRQEHQPAVVYLHPWELDPSQPRQRGTALSRFRHYVNIGRTEERLRRLLQQFSFGTMSAAAEQTGVRASVRTSEHVPAASSIGLPPTAVQGRTW